MELTEICANHIIAHKQRRTEQQRGLGTSGTIGFEELGCYKCEGQNTECEKYFTIPQLEKEEGK